MRLVLDRFSQCGGCAFNGKQSKAKECAGCERNPALGRLKDNYISEKKAQKQQDEQARKGAKETIQEVESSVGGNEVAQKNKAYLKSWGFKPKDQGST